eukprot:4012677-Alexandrium_andersonii.AAC.1
MQDACAEHVGAQRAGTCVPNMLKELHVLNKLGGASPAKRAHDILSHGWTILIVLRSSRATATAREHQACSS